VSQQATRQGTLRQSLSVVVSAGSLPYHQIKVAQSLKPGFTVRVKCTVQRAVPNHWGAFKSGCVLVNVSEREPLQAIESSRVS
jgi:hypothetical protein